jgi:hypothetical protein
MAVTTICHHLPSGRINQIEDLQSRETTNAIQSPAGDHIGTPTLTAGSRSNVSWRTLEPSIVAIHRLP